VVGLWAVLIGVSALAPFLQRDLLDGLVTGNPWDALLPLALALVAVYATVDLMNLLAEYRFEFLKRRSTKDLWIEVYDTLQQRPLSSQRREETGSYLSKILSDGELAGAVISGFVPAISIQVMRLVVDSFVLLVLSWQLAVVAFLSVPLYYALFRRYSREIVALSSREREAFAAIFEHLREKIEGLMTIQALTQEPYFLRATQRKSGEWLESVRKIVWLNRIFESLYSSVRNVFPMVLLAFGVFLVQAQSITIGTLVASFLFVRGIYEPISNLTSTLGSLAQYSPAVSRVLGLTYKPSDEGKRELAERVRVVELRDVHYTFDGEQEVLRGVTLLIHAPEVVSLVGASGSGKSTILLLVAAFLFPTDGSVRFNGLDSKFLASRSIRARVRLVSNNEIIFNMTIRENIILGDSFDDEEIRKILGICGLDALGDRLDVEVGERGLRLSEGERQRLALARAVIRRPDVLLLDEAFSGIDAEAESQIFGRVRAFLPHSIILVVSHRLSTIRKAERVALLSEGRLIAVADHETLLRMEAGYQSLLADQAVEGAARAGSSLKPP